MVKDRVRRMTAVFMSVVMCIVMLSGISFKPITASAICCCKDGFDKSRYSLTGNMAEDVAAIAKSQKGRTCSQFGYSGDDYGAWCDEFVADCIENAGADSSIVAHGGTVADFQENMEDRGAQPVDSPQAGDLVFFSWSHVEIVTRVENGVVYCAGGNNQGKKYPGGICAGERSAQSVANSVGGSIRLYLRPNYNGNPVPPTPTPTPTPTPSLVTPTISTDKSFYNIGDTVYLSWTASPAGSNLSHYWLNVIAPDGTWIYGGTMKKETSYSFVASQSGNYSITTYATPIGSKEGEGSLTDTRTVTVNNPIPELYVSTDYLAIDMNRSRSATIQCSYSNVSW